MAVHRCAHGGFGDHDLLAALVAFEQPVAIRRGARQPAAFLGDGADQLDGAHRPATPSSHLAEHGKHDGQSRLGIDRSPPPDAFFADAAVEGVTLHVLDADRVEVHIHRKHAFGLAGEQGVHIGTSRLDLVQLDLGAQRCSSLGDPVGHVGLGDGARSWAMVHRVDTGDAHHLAQQLCDGLAGCCAASGACRHAVAHESPLRGGAYAQRQPSAVECRRSATSPAGGPSGSNSTCQSVKPADRSGFATNAGLDD